MKWSSILLICALALLSNACEQHKASELEEEKHGAEVQPGATAASPDKEKKPEEGKPGEAPKFFPEKK